MGSLFTALTATSSPGPRHHGILVRVCFVQACLKVVRRGKTARGDVGLRLEKPTG